MEARRGVELQRLEVTDLAGIGRALPEHFQRLVLLTWV